MSPTLLLLLLVLLACASLAPILWPLLKLRRADTFSGEALEQPAKDGAALWRDQKTELDRLLAAGAIEQSEHESQLAALTLAAKSDLSNLAPTAMPRHEPAISRRRPLLAAALAVLVVAVAVPLYLQVGSIDYESRLAQAQAERAASNTVDPRVVAMVQGLAKKLADRPDDVKGFTLLGRSYLAIGRADDAVAAYRHALTLSPAGPSLMADLANAVALQAAGRLAGEPSDLIAKALSLDPDNIKALELSGSAALQRNDPVAARQAWSHLAALLPKDSDDARQVQAALQQIGQNDAASPASPAASDPSASISGTLDLAPSIASQVALTDVVYLFARDAKSQDTHTPPLAVMRVDAKKLPVAYTLSDQMSMDGVHKLSDATQLVVEARVAKHGTPMQMPGDLIAAPVTVKLGASHVDLLIDRVAR